VTGALSLREGWLFTWVFYALALIPTWAVVVFPHTTLAAKIGAPLPWHETFYIYLAGMIFTLIYSVPSSWGRTKARGMWANWTIAIPRGCLLKVAGWAMVARIGHWEPWALGSIFMLFLVGAASTKDFADIKGDAAGGCKTLPILHGPKKAAWIIAPFFIFPWLLVPLFAHLPDPQNPSHPILTGNQWALTGLGALPDDLGLLHRLPDPARSRRPDAHREPPQLEADVPDDDGRPDRLRGRLSAAALRLGASRLRRRHRDCATVCAMSDLQASRTPQVGVRELRQNLSVYLDRVKEGERLEVTEHGRPVALLVPLPDDDDQLERMIAEGRAIPATRDLAESLCELTLPCPRLPGAKPLSQILQEMRDEETF
jgi:prevent-host-death family protein